MSDQPTDHNPHVLTPRQEHMIQVRDGIAPGQPTAIVPRTFAEAQAFAGALANSELVPFKLKERAPDILLMLLAGAELGFPPIRAMSLFHPMDGVPKLSADGVAALVMASPLCEMLEPREQSTTRVVWIAKRRGRPEQSLAWTIEDAKAAGLSPGRPNRDGSPGNWIKYPRQMLNARCKADLARLVWPDICAGLVTAEEAIDIPSEAPPTFAPPTPASRSSAPPALQAMADASAGKPSEVATPAASTKRGAKADAGKSATAPAGASPAPKVIDTTSTETRTAARSSDPAASSARSTPSIETSIASSGSTDGGSAAAADPTPRSSATPPSSETTSPPPVATPSDSPTEASRSSAPAAGASADHDDFGEAAAAPLPDDPASEFAEFQRQLGAIQKGPDAEDRLQAIKDRWIPWSKTAAAQPFVADVRAAFAATRKELVGR